VGKSAINFIKDNIVLVDGLPYDDKNFAFVGHYEEGLSTRQYISQILYYIDDKDWLDRGRYNWQSLAISQYFETDMGSVVLGRDGQVIYASPDGSVKDEIVDDLRTIGPLRGLYSEAGMLLAYGMRRQIYQRNASGKWTRFENGLLVGHGDDEDVSSIIMRSVRTMGGINAVVRDRFGKYYAVGWKGEIYSSEGAFWSSIDSPTNVQLTDVVADAEGVVYVCGHKGALLKGNARGFAHLEYDGPQDLDFCSVATFAGKTYVADGFSLRVLEDDRLKLVDFGVGNGPVPSTRVRVTRNLMMSLAGKEVFITKDGESWKAIID
jgi:hypothetical protein